jgi:thiamine biosynthesis protein ThiI
MTRASALLLVRYYELALKGKHRKGFTRLLCHNLREALGPLRCGSLRSLSGRIAVPLRAAASREAVQERIGPLYGVANYSFARAVAPRLDALLRAVQESPELIEPSGAFRVRCRRADKSFPLHSAEIERRLGAFVHESFGLSVDLERPALEILVEVLPGRIFVSFGKRPGAGGLPTGSSGPALALISGGIDSPVAAARIARRGAPVRLLHFSGQPFTDRASERKVREHAQLLARSQLRSELHQVPFGEVQRKVAVGAPARLRIVLYRRLMLRIAERIAERTGALALVTGESLGQVASQTLQNLAVIDQAARLPVLRPLIGLDKDEIVAEARALGTYEISIRPGSDCCQVFATPRAATGARLEVVLEAESRLDVPALVEMALSAERLESFSLPPAMP